MRKIKRIIKKISELLQGSNSFDKKKVREKTGRMMQEMENNFVKGEDTVTSLLTLGMLYRQYNLLGKGDIIVQSKMNRDKKQ